MLKCLPELLRVGVRRQGVFSESIFKKTLPEDNSFIGGVVPRLGIANLRLSKALYVRCAYRFTNGAVLVCKVLRLVV
jgi:hypothetical protein